MEEAEQSLESKEDRLKNGTDPPNGAVGKVSTEMRNGDGNMEEVKNNVDDDNSSEDLKAVAEAEHSGDIKDGEDEKNLKEVKVMEERNSAQQTTNGDEDKDNGETKVVFEKEATEAVDGDEKEVGDSQDMEGKNNLGKAKYEEWKKEVEVQNEEIYAAQLDIPCNAVGFLQVQFIDLQFVVCLIHERLASQCIFI